MAMPSLSERAFRQASATQRQMRAYREECQCTRALHRQYARRYELLERILVIDGSGFRWEGLGNSCTRWIGLLRWGLATERAVYLRLTRDCGRNSDHREKPDDRTCHLDLGDYFTGWGGVEWHWGAEEETKVGRRQQLHGGQEVVVHYSCAAYKAPGCAIASLRFNNGSSLQLAEPQGLLEWFRSAAAPDWIRLVIMGQQALEFSYSKPEQMRTNLGQPFTECAVRNVKGWADREKRLKCETFALMQPRPRLMQALLPALTRMEPFDVVVGVHLRTGYADWSTRNPHAFFSKLATSAKDASIATAVADTASDPRGRVSFEAAARWSIHEHWRRLDSYFQDCRAGRDGPCFNWEYPHWGAPPRMSDAARCQLSAHSRTHRGASARTNFSMSTPQGFLSALIQCAVNLAHSLVEQRHQSSAAPNKPKWALLVLSDSEAFPSLVARLPELRGKVITTEVGSAIASMDQAQC